MPGSESQRHSWVKLREHTYICRVCGCGRVNAQKSGGWETTFHLPDGTSRVLSKRPACAVGPHTDEYLGKYWPAIERLTEHTERIAKALDQDDPNPDDMPKAVCPKCGAEQNDFDGFGIVYCPACKFCTHPSRDGDVCGICGDRATDDDNPDDLPLAGD